MSLNSHESWTVRLVSLALSCVSIVACRVESQPADDDNDPSDDDTALGDYYNQFEVALTEDGVDYDVSTGPIELGYGRTVRAYGEGDTCTESWYLDGGALEAQVYVDLYFPEPLAPGITTDLSIAITDLPPGSLPWLTYRDAGTGGYLGLSGGTGEVEAWGEMELAFYIHGAQRCSVPDMNADEYTDCLPTGTLFLSFILVAGNTETLMGELPCAGMSDAPAPGPGWCPPREGVACPD